MNKYFWLNDPNSEYAKEVVENNRKIDTYLDRSREVPEDLKKKSVNQIVLLQGTDPDSKACNWNCDICYTRDRFNLIGLNGSQLIDLINEVKKLGARGLYIPGIGEPTKNKAFWDYLKHESKTDRFPILIFTNGSYLYDKGLQEEIGLREEEILSLVKENNLYQYVKFWTSDPKKAKNMYGIEVPYVEREGIKIPYSLDLLLKTVPKERVGIETVLRSDNKDEILNEIVPFCENDDIKCFIEPVIPVNWVKKGIKLDNGEEDKLEKFLAITKGGSYCENRASRDMIINVDTLSPCVVFPRVEEYNGIDNKGKVKSSDELFEIFHDENYREIRKEFSSGNCACKKVLSREIKWNF